MKKTVNINLGNRVFQIDEDAYLLLETYLKDLKHYFSKEKGCEEIVQDIEYRLSELFDEKVKLGHYVVTIEIAEQMIGRIGRPEELCDENSETGERQKADNKESGRGQSRLKEEPVRKRLYRDPDDRIIGGVASGIAAYLGCDPVWIRLLFVALLFFKGIVAGLYILLLIIMPKAKTASQKLEMRGKRITVENIGKTVTETFDRTMGGLDEELNLQNKESGIRRLLNVFLHIIGALFKIVLGVLAILLCFPLLIVAIVLVVVGVGLFVGLITGSAALLANFPFAHIPYDEIMIMERSLQDILLMSGHSTAFLWWGLFASCLALLLPLVVLFYLLVGSFRPLKPINNILKWTLFGLWIISVGFAIYFFNQLLPFATYHF